MTSTWSLCLSQTPGYKSWNGEFCISSYLLIIYIIQTIVKLFSRFIASIQAFYEFGYKSVIRECHKIVVENVACSLIGNSF